MPPQGLPLTKLNTPRAISRKPKAEPNMVVMRVAQRRLPRRCQRTERSMRPPSRGKAGTRLKATRVPLITPRYSRTAVTGPGQPASHASSASTRQKPAIRTLAIGPATAVINSAVGSGGSPSIWATPPKMNSVMPRIRSP